MDADGSRLHGGSSIAPGTSPSAAGRYAALHADVAARIGKVCADLPADQFDGLVRDICTVKLRWDPDAAPQQRP